MSPDTKVKLAELSELSIGQLAAKYEKLFGEKCRSRKGLAVQSFYQWKRKLLQPVLPKDNHVLVKPVVQSLVPVRIVPSNPKPTSLPIQIVTPSGFEVRVDSSMPPSEVAILVASIEVSLRGESC